MAIVKKSSSSERLLGYRTYTHRAVAKTAIALSLTTLVVLGACSSGSNSSNANPSSGAQTAEGSTSGSEGGTTQGTTVGSTGGQTEGSVAGSTPADVQILQSESVSLDGSVKFTGVPSDIPVISWRKLTGPGNAIFSNPQSSKSDVEFDMAGIYELELSAANGAYSASDTVMITVTSVIVNQAPSVNAGANETVLLNEVLNLTARVDDDGLPNDSLTELWKKVSGPGSVTFGEVSARSTTATFSTTGKYVLEFSSNDGELTDEDSITITVNSGPVVNPPANNINASNVWQTVNASNGRRVLSHFKINCI